MTIDQYSIVLLSMGRCQHVKRLRFVVLCQLHLFRQGGTRLSRWPSRLPAGGSPRFFTVKIEENDEK